MCSNNTGLCTIKFRQIQKAIFHCNDLGLTVPVPCPSPHIPSPHLRVARIDVSSTLKGTYRLMSDLHGVS